MPKYVHILSCVLTVVGPTVAGAQNTWEDKPVEPKALSRRALERREALKLYGAGLMCERDNRLLEAAKRFEEAQQLDPKSTAIHKALIPLYLALERPGDALAACRRTVELAPAEHETWYLLGRLLKERGEAEEAMTALARALAGPRLKEQPELRVQIASELGQMREERKDFEGALAAYAEVVKVLDRPAVLLEAGPFTRQELDAKGAEVCERMGTLALQARKYDRAMELFTRAQKKDPEAAGRLNYHLARVQVAQARPAEALPYLDDYLKTQPQAAEPYELKITLMQQTGREAEVLAALQAYAERDQHNLNLHLLLARQYARERRWAEAEDSYKKLVAESPSPEGYRGLFQLYRSQGPAKVADVFELLDKAFQEAGDKQNAGNGSAALRARAMLVVLRDDAQLVKTLLRVAERELNGPRPHERDTWRYLAVLAARTKQLDAAEKIYARCLQKLTPGGEAEVYVGYLRVLWQKKKTEAIVRVCRQGLQEAQATNRLLFHENLALALVQLGKMDEALAEVDEAIKVADDRNRLHYRLVRARYLGMAQQLDQALAECRRLLKEAGEAKDLRDIRYTLSSIHTAGNQFAQAEEQLRLILAADPNDDAANNDLGYILADQGKKLDEAEQLIRKAIRLDREQKRSAERARPEGGAEEAAEPRQPKIDADDDQDHAAYIDSLGWVLFRRGKLEAARQELEKATRLSDGGDDPVIWDHLGDVYLRLGQSQQARSAWEKSEKLYEVDRRRQRDKHYRDLQQKLKLLP